VNSRVYNGFIEHARLDPVSHRFRNNLSFYAFDLSELPSLSEQVPGFGWNRFSALSLRESDYLGSGPESLQEKLQPWIEKLDLPQPPDRITLVTSLRWLGYVFNPVSFYLLDQGDAGLVGLISEVNNTFGDRHVYAVPLEKKSGIHQQNHAKEFHVSPFNDLTGSYRFTVRRENDELYIGVDLYRKGTKILEAWMEGGGKPFTSRNVWKKQLRHPLRPWLTLPRIIWQAIFLKYRHKLPIVKRIKPEHPHTIHSKS
jgi:cyclopropane-fatty-acyl-phospholipid synthase